MPIALCFAQVIHSQISASPAYFWSFCVCQGRINIFIQCLFENFAVQGVYLGKSLVTLKIYKFFWGLRKFFWGKFFCLNNLHFAIHPLAMRSVLPPMPYACTRIKLQFENLILLWGTTCNTEHKNLCNPFQNFTNLS